MSFFEIELIFDIFTETILQYIAAKPIEMKNLSFLLILFFGSYFGFSQVGVGTTTPESALDVTSPNNGILIPRIALVSNTDNVSVVNPNGGLLVDGTMVWNTGTGGLNTPGYYYWENNQWNKVINNNERPIYFGKLIITGLGVIAETGVGFAPSAVEFTAINRVQDYDDGAYRGSTNNSNDIRIAGGFTTGYAQNNSGIIDQQVIANAFSGNSINNIGTYSSDTHCIAALFVDNNANVLADDGTSGGASTQEGLVRAAFQSFDADGFTINVDRFLGPTTTSPDRTNAMVVIYKAYR